jgi:glycosyltransferase involved in cell wall biosynthesis
MIRIGFDARMAGFRHAGIGRYTEELLRQLVQEKTLLIEGKKTKVQWVIFLSPSTTLTWLLEMVQDSKNNIEVCETGIRHYSLLEQLWFWFTMKQKNLDLLHVPHFNVPLAYFGRTIVTIHDLLWHTHRDPRATTLPAWLYWLKYGFYRLITKSAIARAHTVLVPTKAVKDDIARLEGRKQKVLVTSEGLSQPYSTYELSSSHFSKLKRSEKYVIYTGSLYPHKNVETLLKVLRQNPELRLKIASSRNIFTEHFEQMAEAYSVRGQVDMLGYVSDSEIIPLYQNAIALVQPSLAEGFGLTGLEALSVGCPVVVSDIPVFHEVYKDAAVFAKSRDVFGWSEAIQTLQQNPPSFAERQRCQKIAQSYRWDACANATLEAYMAALTV